jgi:predicted nuclease of predicted toxin-antitoxin system
VKIRFQADADLNEDIVTGVTRREPVVDFRTAAEAGFRGAKDEAVLAMAAAAGRVLVSHDLKTMPREFAAFVVAQTSPGVLIVSQKLSLLDAIEELVLIWTASEAEDWVNRIATIPV